MPQRSRGSLNICAVYIINLQERIKRKEKKARMTKLNNNLIIEKVGTEDWGLFLSVVSVTHTRL